MEDAAKQMEWQMRRYQQEMTKLTQDPTMMSNPSIKGRVNPIQANAAPTMIRNLRMQTQELLKVVVQVLNASGTK
jgi:hypothetical protein